VTVTSPTTESALRAMTRPERVAHLLSHGWYRLSARGAQSWFAPGWVRVSQGDVEPPEHDRCFYSLAAAIRADLRCGEPLDDELAAAEATS
jgi:hypothetical protein